MELQGPIREFDVGDVFTDVFKTYGANIGPFVTIAAIAMSPSILSAPRIVRLMSPGVTADFLELVAWQLLNGLSSTFGYGLIAWGAFRSARGKPAGAADYLDLLKRRWWAILLVAILFGAIIAGGLLLCCVPGLIAMVVLYVALPATVVEGTGPIESLQRSWDLTEGYRWRILGVAVLIGIVGMIVQLPLQFLAMSTGHLLAAQLIVTVTGALLLPLHSGALGLVYYRLRSIKEYVDADDIADVFS